MNSKQVHNRSCVYPRMLLRCMRCVCGYYRKINGEHTSVSDVLYNKECAEDLFSCQI